MNLKQKEKLTFYEPITKKEKKMKSKKSIVRELFNEKTRRKVPHGFWKTKKNIHTAIRYYVEDHLKITPQEAGGIHAKELHNVIKSALACSPRASWKYWLNLTYPHSLTNTIGRKRRRKKRNVNTYIVPNKTLKVSFASKDFKEIVKVLERLEDLKINFKMEVI